MLQEFKKHITGHLSFLKEKKLLVAISGGLDSVVLTHLCIHLKWNISLAHCNFKLRANQSDEDQIFIETLAKNFNKNIFSESFDTEKYAQNKKLSIQMAARELRYNWFETLREQQGFEYVLTAHHADDNLETFLINLSRGTGLEGLKGIPEINGTIVRPLLRFSKEVLLNYAEQNDIKWREDSSNISTKYLRNKIRHQVIPSLKEINPQLVNNFNSTLDHLYDSSIIITQSIDAFLKEAIKIKDKDQISYHIAVFKTLNYPKAYLYEVFKKYGFTDWNAILKLLYSQTGKQLFSKTHRLLKNRQDLILTKIQSKSIKTRILITLESEKIKINKGILILNMNPSICSSNVNEIYIDKELLKFPLVVRSWEEGDYFYPTGMQGKKKLSKYFKDEKLSILEKQKAQVLCSKNKIVWIIGRRADNRFKISDKTKNILKMTFQE